MGALALFLGCVVLVVVGAAIAIDAITTPGVQFAQSFLGGGLIGAGIGCGRAVLTP
jgi:hypothetical protein